MSRLHYAARRGLLEELKEGLAKGMPVDERSPDGSTPLHLAASSNQAKAVKMLLDAGADPTALDRARHTPLILAAAVGDLEAVQVLVDAGSTINAADSFGRTALTSAAMSNHPHVVEFLLERGADATVSTAGRTAPEWLSNGGVSRAADPEEEQRAVKPLIDLFPDPDEFAAHHGRNTCIFGFREDFLPLVAANWVRRVRTILSSPPLLAWCEDRFLSGERLEEAIRRRERSTRVAARRKLRDARRSPHEGSKPHA